MGKELKSWEELHTKVLPLLDEARLRAYGPEMDWSIFQSKNWDNLTKQQRIDEFKKVIALVYSKSQTQNKKKSP